MGPLRFFLLAVIALLGILLRGSDALRVRYCSSLNTGKLQGFEAGTLQFHYYSSGLCGIVSLELILGE